MSIKIITLKSIRYKHFIGFSSNPKEWINNWLSKRSQYDDLKEISSTHYTVLYDNDEINHFYITNIRDGEDFWVSLNDNCMGFNDFH